MKEYYTFVFLEYLVIHVKISARLWSEKHSKMTVIAWKSTKKKVVKNG
jgi:hypothetical protein